MSFFGLFDSKEEKAQKREEERKQHEVERAETEMYAAVKGGGDGMSHDRIVLFDTKAHNIVHRIASMPLARAEYVVKMEYDYAYLKEDLGEGERAALDSIRNAVLIPALKRIESVAIAQMVRGARDWLASNDSATRKGFHEVFLNTIAPTVMGCEPGEDHWLANKVWESQLASLAPAEKAQPTKIDESGDPSDMEIIDSTDVRHKSHSHGHHRKHHG